MALRRNSKFLRSRFFLLTLYILQHFWEWPKNHNNWSLDSYKLVAVSFTHLNKKLLQNSFKACCPVLRDSRTAPAGSGTGRWWTLERTMVLTPGTAVGTWSRLRASPAPAVTRSSHTLTFNYFGKNRNCPWFSPGAVCRARLSVTRYVYISNISCILVLLIWLLHYLLVETSEDTWQIYAAYHVSKHPGTTRVPFFAPHYTSLSTTLRVVLHCTCLTPPHTIACPGHPLCRCSSPATSPNYTVVSFNLKLIIQVFCMPKVCIILSIFTLYALLYCNSLQNDLSQLTC